MFLKAISLRVGEYTIVSELFHISITFLLQRIIFNCIGRQQLQCHGNANLKKNTAILQTVARSSHAL